MNCGAGTRPLKSCLPDSPQTPVSLWGLVAASGQCVRTGPKPLPLLTVAEFLESDVRLSAQPGGIGPFLVHSYEGVNGEGPP